MYKYYCLILCCLFLASCAVVKNRKFLSGNKKSVSIHPSSTVLGQKSQYAIVGKELDSATVKGGKSLKIEHLQINPDGRSLKVYITVNRLAEADSLDKPGKRIVGVQTRKGMEKVILHVMDEQ